MRRRGPLAGYSWAISVMGEADEATSALIAQLLSEDAQYYDGAGYVYDDGGSGCEGGSSSRRRKRSRSQRSGKRKSQPNGGRKQKAKKSAGKIDPETGLRSGKWTDEEERLFLEALRLFGRDYGAGAAHVKTRSRHNFTSHAQKHFVKLYIADKPLPPKVAESGMGFTLSGKPLDPESAAARSYGVRHPLPRTRTGAENVPGNGPREKTPREINDELLAQAKARGDALGQKTNGVVAATGGKGAKATLMTPEERARKKAEAMRKAAEKKKRVEEKRRKAEEKRQAKMKAAREKMRRRREKLGVDANGQTAYSRSRSRRRAATKFVANPSTNLQFMQCGRYDNASAASVQPFDVSVRSSVHFLADLHAHLSTAEVMGFLAGTWDPTAKIDVVAAYPGKSLEEGSTECEMDPCVEVMLKERIQSEGLQVVGWYHSHPTFEPIPSMCDVDTQTNYQALFRDARSGEDPFIALIVSPYDARLPSARSQMHWFHVYAPSTLKRPMVVETTTVVDAALPESVRERARDLVASSAASAHAVEYGERWYSVASANVTYRQKICKSLECRVNAGCREDIAFVEELAASL